MAATVATSPARAAPAARMRLLAAAPQSSPAASSVAHASRASASARPSSPDSARACARASWARPEFPGRRHAHGERERAFARRERGVEIKLLGREVAEGGEQLDPQLDRCVIARGRKRQIEEAPSLGDALDQREVQPERPEPTRDRWVGRLASVLQAQPRDCRFLAPGALPQRSHCGPRSSTRAWSASAAKYSAWAPRGGGESAAPGEKLDHVLADGIEHVVAGGAARERGRDDRLVDQRGAEIRHGRLVEAARRCDRRRATKATPLRGERQARGAASSRPRARGRSSTPRAPAGRYDSGRRPGCREGARRDGRGRRRAPRARAR